MGKAIEYIKPDFQFYLRLDRNNYYTLNDAGGVVLTNQKTAIDTGIVNWNDIKFSWVRHATRRGIFRKQSTVIKFAKESGKILRHLYNTGGRIMAYCEFVVEILDPHTGNYTTQFINNIDFATYDSKQYWVEAKTMEGGLSELLNAYENTPYEVTVDLADAIKVNMDGIIIKTRYRYITANYTDIINTIYNDLQVGYVRQEGDLDSGYGVSVIMSSLTRYYCFASNYETDINVNLNFKVDYTISMSSSANDSFSVMYEVYNNAGLAGAPVSSGTVYAAPLVNVSGGAVTTSVNINKTTRIHMPSGCYLRLFVERTVDKVLFGLSYTVNDGVMLIDTETNSAQSTDRVANTRLGYRLYQVFRKVLALMTNNRYTLADGILNSTTALSKDYYDAVPYDEVIVSEEALKKLYDVPFIKITLSDLIEDVIAMGMGCGIKNNQLVIAPLAEFYNQTVIGEIKSVNELEIIADPDAVFNNIEIGYEGGDSIDDINRVNAFNCKQYRKAPITRLLDKNDQTLSFVSPIYAEPQYIELVRIQNLNDKITINNTRKDETNRNFKVHISRTASSGIYDLKRGGTITGIDFAAQSYNAALTPTRQALRLSGLMKSKLFGLPSQLVTFQKNEQNNNMMTNLSSAVGPIIERTDIDYGLLPAPLIYKPDLIKFKGVPPRNLFELMESDPEKTWKFEWLGIMLYGFVINATINQANLEAYEFIFQMSPVVDNTKLIY